MTKSIDEKISAFEAKLKQLKEQKKIAENIEKKKAKEQERKDDTRRKILLGAMCLQMMKDDEQAYQKILLRMEKFLTEERDRKLFNLPEIKNNDPQPAQPINNFFNKENLI